MNTKRTRRGIASLCLLLALLLLFLIFYRLRHGDPQLAKVEKLRQQMASEETRKLSLEQQRELRRQFGREVQKLAPADRQKLFAERQRRSRERLQNYFSLPRQQQIAMLDEDINRMERMRQQAGNQSGQNPPQGGRGPSSAEDRDRRRRDRLDQTTPEDRAMFAEYFSQLRARRQQRGMMGPGR
jgi:hypothetical protein